MDLIHSLVFLSGFKESTFIQNAQQVMANLGKIKSSLPDYLAGKSKPQGAIHK